MKEEFVFDRIQKTEANQEKTIPTQPNENFAKKIKVCRYKKEAKAKATNRFLANNYNDSIA